MHEAWGVQGPAAGALARVELRLYDSKLELARSEEGENGAGERPGHV